MNSAKEGMGPGEAENLAFTLWLAQLRSIRLILDDLCESFIQDMPIESLLRTAKEYDAEKQKAREVLQSTDEMLDRLKGTTQDIIRHLG